MKKSKFIQSSIILLIGGLITKVLGLIIKILLTRKVGVFGMGLYSMIMPTFMLLLSISGMGLSNALNVLIATNKYNNKNLIITALIFSLTMDLIIFMILFLFGNIIANSLLQDQRLYYPLLSIAFVLPFISFSNIFRCYYFAKERMLPHVISNILEDLIKFFIMLSCLFWFYWLVISNSFIKFAIYICHLLHLYYHYILFEINIKCFFNYLHSTLLIFIELYITVNRILRPTAINRLYIPIDKLLKIIKIIVRIKQFIKDILKFSLARFKACNELNKGASK